MPYVVEKLNQLPVFKSTVSKLKHSLDLTALKLRFISVASWSADELDFPSDLEDLDKLSTTRKYLLASILIFFKDGDKVIIDNCVSGFPSLFSDNQIDMDFLSYKDRRNAIEWYSFQTANETTHNISYNDAINCYYINNSEFRKIFDEVNILMKDKIRTLEQLVSSSIEDSNSLKLTKESVNHNIAKHMLNFLLVEGIGFHSNFALVFYFKSLNIMHTLVKQNNFIHRDEGYHAKFALELMISTGLNNYLSIDYIKDSIRKFVKLECTFLDQIRDILYEKKPDSYTLKSISIEGLKIYIKSLANDMSQRLCNQLIYEIDINKIPFYVRVAETSTIANGIEIKNNSYTVVQPITESKLLSILEY